MRRACTSKPIWHNTKQSECIISSELLCAAPASSLLPAGRWETHSLGSPRSQALQHIQWLTSFTARNWCSRPRQANTCRNPTCVHTLLAGRDRIIQEPGHEGCICNNSPPKAPEKMSMGFKQTRGPTSTRLVASPLALGFSVAWHTCQTAQCQPSAWGSDIWTSLTNKSSSGAYASQW